MRFLRWLYTIWVGICFIVPMLVLFPFFLIYPLFGLRGNLWLASVSMIGWFRLFLFLVGIRMKVVDPHGYRRIRPAVLVSNHQSFLDTPIVKSACGFGFMPLGKKEQTRMPVLGWIYRHNVVLVDRSNPESRARSMRYMDGLLKRAIGVFVFAEGTMNRTDYLVKSFYDGAFRLSIENQVPLVPFALTNTRHIMPRGQYPVRWPRTVTVAFGAPLSPAGMQEEDIPTLKEQAYDSIYQLMKAYAPPTTIGYNGPKAPLDPPRRKKKPEAASA